MVIYQITVHNYLKYNPGNKKTHKKTFIANNFCDDGKLLSLPLSTCWFYLGIILLTSECGLDTARDTIRVPVKTLQRMLRGNVNLEKVLNQLQSFQLLTYEKSGSNIIESKVREDKVKEDKRSSAEVEKLDRAKEENKQIKETYLNAFRLRYGVEPNVKSAQFNSQVSNLRKKLGLENAIKVVEFYLSHNDGFYLKQTHSFGLCLKDADTLFVQMQKGKAITTADVRRFEKAVQVQQTLKESKEGNF